MLAGAIAVTLLALLPLACSRISTRFEDHATLRRDPAGGWTLAWTTIARRGLNPVDSSGNVGSASASFRCQPDPVRQAVWTVTGRAIGWAESGAAVDALGPPAVAWHGTVTVEDAADGKALVIALHADDGRAFAGNRRYLQVRGVGDGWSAH